MSANLTIAYFYLSIRFRSPLVKAAHADFGVPHRPQARCPQDIGSRPIKCAEIPKRKTHPRARPHRDILKWKVLHQPIER